MAKVYAIVTNDHDKDVLKVYATASLARKGVERLETLDEPCLDYNFAVEAGVWCCFYVRQYELETEVKDNE